MFAGVSGTVSGFLMSHLPIKLITTVYLNDVGEVALNTCNPNQKIFKLNKENSYVCANFYTTIIFDLTSIPLKIWLDRTAKLINTL